MKRVPFFLSLLSGLLSQNLVVWLILGFSFGISACTVDKKVDRRTPADLLKPGPEDIQYPDSTPNPNENDGESPEGKPQPFDPETQDEGPGSSGQGNSNLEITPLTRTALEIEEGKRLYEKNCVSCHATLNRGDIGKFQPKCNSCGNLERFVQIVSQTMPKNSIGSCDRRCATKIGFYLFP